MKINSILFCFLLFAARAQADIAYLPLRFGLTTSKPSYEEGEKIEFILTIRNADETRSFPVVTPGGQNSGSKLVYLRVYDPARNIYVQRGMESREMNMLIKHLGIQGLEWVAPGKEIKIKFYWNDWEHYFSDPASHHSFGKPLFAGRYVFQAFYDPFGNGAGDSLYHLSYSTEDEQSPTKLNFLGAQLSTPCEVVIAKTKAESFMIEGSTYVCPKSEREEYYQYCLGTKADSNQVCIISGILPNGAASLEVRMYKYNNREWIQHFDNGDIRKYSLWDERRCPDQYYEREYYPDEKHLALKTDTTADGSVIRTAYNENGSLNRVETYSMTDHVYTLIEYIYKDGKLRRKKKTRGEFKVPCEDIVEIIKT